MLSLKRPSDLAVGLPVLKVRSDIFVFIKKTYEIKCGLVANKHCNRELPSNDKLLILLLILIDLLTPYFASDEKKLMKNFSDNLHCCNLKAAMQ